MNKIVHERSRLKLLTKLATGKEHMTFTELRDELGMTGGNLSVQLKTLEDAGYVESVKYFAENKPRTELSLTESGRAALMEYLDELEALLAGLRGNGTNG